MPGGTFDLFQKKIAETYQRVVQYDSSSFALLDGRGDPIKIVITGSLSGSIDADSIDFNILSAAPAYQEGRIFYDNTDKTLGLYGDISGVTLQIGQEQWIKVRNNTGAIINNGTAVWINGAQGNRPTVARTSTNAHSSSMVVGLATHDIANNSDGYVTVQGLVRGLNTSGYANGSLLYLSGSNGGYSSSKYDAPAHSNLVGYCIYSHNTQGIVLVRTSFIPELTELHDVVNGVGIDGNLLYYNSTKMSWSGSIGRNFILNSSSYIGIGTKSPTSTLDVHGNARITGSLTVTGSLIRSLTTITDNYICNTDDKIILANTHKAFSASLVSPIDGESIIFKVVGNFPLTIQPQPGATIDGSSNLIINTKWSAVEMIASASNWYII